jgi:molybdenum cofactor biosynthesis protein A
MLIDNHGRPLEYLRMAVTDRCNLRCAYCMPEKGLDWVPRNDLLSYEEIFSLLQIFSELGLKKLRFTGGEPFLRKDFMKLLRKVAKANLFSQIAITTNGSLTRPFIRELKEIGIHSVNLSLDTLDPQRFKEITRRDEFHEVYQCLIELVENQIPVKINSVIMEGINEEDILELVKLTAELPVDVRFIEEMPFNGGDKYAKIKWTDKKLIEHIRSFFPTLEKSNDKVGSTSSNYYIPGHLGKVGVIAAFSRTFCGACNRVRITPKGQLKTCLYDEGVLDLKTLIRSGTDIQNITAKIRGAFNSRAVDGFEAESLRMGGLAAESMATIGG